MHLRIIRNYNRLTFGIYRKPIHTECYIKSNGYNPKSHQHSVFTSLVYRLFNPPLEQTEYTKEYEDILNSAIVNCFDKHIVGKKIITFRRLKPIIETTTLSTLDKGVTYKKFTYHPWAHYEFNKIFKHHNIVVTPQNKY